MEANRFEEFRKALYQVWQTLREHNQDQVDKLFWMLAQKFPEIDGIRKEEGIETKLQQLQLQQPPNAEKATAAQPPNAERVTVAQAQALKRKKE